MNLPKHPVHLALGGHDFLKEATQAAWSLGLAALLFNPFLPPHLEAGVWAMLDWAAAGVVGYGFYKLSPPAR